MDSSASNIIFNEEGNCNFCEDFILNDIKIEKLDINPLLKKIKEDGKGKKYDCIVGLSGGVDSSYTLLKTIELGLRPLAVHLDNGWNSETASSNISSLVESLKVDLHTHVINWKENRDLQLSFIKANVIDIEMLMDNAQAALNFQMAKKHKIKHILSGSNSKTEGIAAPKNWTHFKFDVKNIKAIHRKYGSHKIKTHPLISTLDYLYFTQIKKIKWVFFLDYLDYDKITATSELVKIGYKPYLHKHYESVFTRFYQGYILPNKFNVDKRKMHLSALILTGLMNREDGLNELKKSPYSDENLLNQDKDFVIKKLRMNNESFDEYILQKPVLHDEFPSEKSFFNFLLKIKNRYEK